LDRLRDILFAMENGVNRVISPKDEMYLFARSRLPSDEAARTYYFDTGKELAIGVIRHLLENGVDPQTSDLLDYAAGYGRVTRWLAPAFRKVTAADLEPEMIDFQKRQNGVDGFIAPVAPALLRDHQRRYDAVFVFSLFTHLPETSLCAWLRSVAQLVRRGGSLFFSTHSYELFAELLPHDFDDPTTWVDEFVFWEGNETNGRLGADTYGSTIVTDSYVRTAVARMIGFEIAGHYKKGDFDRYHDMYVVRPLIG
jgi:SAM-dependent methyltransferase